ncbi:hypothetical protein HY635_00595 [Candidatus Uhrbacteria bacterium]|nr:hypothetical protein [Candidatus Uhrbacteria bacterium]
MALSKEELRELAEKIQTGAATPEEVLRFSREVNALLEQLNNTLRS